MIPFRSKYLIFISLALMLVGYGLTWLMVLRIVESTFFLNFFSYGAMVAGLFLGATGIATYVRGKRGDNDRR